MSKPSTSIYLSDCDVVKVSPSQFLFLTAKGKVLFEHKEAEQFIPEIFRSLAKGATLDEVHEGLSNSFPLQDLKSLFEALIKSKVIRQSSFHSGPVSILCLSDRLLSFLPSNDSAVSLISSPQKTADALPLVVISDLAYRSQMPAVANRLKDLKQPWIWIELGPQSLQIGPLFQHGDSFCFDCLSVRRLANAQNLDRELLLLKPTNQVLQAPPRKNFALWAEMISNFLPRLQSDDELAKLQTGLQTYDFERDQTGFHPVLKSPVCPSCHPAVSYDHR